MTSFHTLAAETVAQALDVAQRLEDFSVMGRIVELQHRFTELPEPLHWDVLDEVQVLKDELLESLPDPE